MRIVTAILITTIGLVLPAAAAAESWSGYGGAGLAQGPSGTIYSADPNSLTVKYFSPTGTGLASFGGPGTGDGQFTMDVDVAVATSGEVYVVDGGSPVRVERFSAGGGFIGKWGSSGCANGQFNAARAIATGGSSIGPTVYVGDQNCPAPPAARIQAFSPDGTYQWTFGTADLTRVSGLSTANDGSVWVAEGKAHKVFHYSSGGTLLGSFPVQPVATTGDYPQDISWTTDGVYIVNAVSKQAEKYSEAGAFIGSVALGDSYGSLLKLPDSLLLGFSAKSEVTRVDTTTPVAALNVSPNPTAPLQTVSFDASASQMPFGSITSYEFDTDGNGSYDVTQATPTYSRSYAQRANFVASVRVTGSNGVQAMQSVPVLVGPAGISINGGAQFTNSPNVTIAVVWPLNSESVLVSNDGGFTPATAFPVTSSVPWVLNSSGPERLPKTVYSRFTGGTAGNETYQDDIILDQTPPVIAAATATPASAAGARVAAKAKGTRIKLRATDNVSGVATYQLTRKKTVPGNELKYASSFKYKGKFPVNVRVRDAAGNFSKWKTLKAPNKKVKAKAKKK
jgi:hypothetical protein